MIVRLYRRLRQIADLAIRAPHHIDALKTRLADLAMTLGRVELTLASLSTRAGRIEGDINAMRQLLFRFNDVSQATAECGGDRASAPERVAGPTGEPSRDEVFRLLQSRYPKAYPLWERLFQNALDTYLQNPDENLSTNAHSMAPRFKDYVTRFAFGRVLDIGCGPLALPCYLADLDPAKIAGIDPLAPLAEHPFVFRHGVAEAIPWADATFETLIAATSLDHVVSIRAALSEFRRILGNGGRFITWVGFLPGGRPFDPERENPTSVDDYHLFHFDEGWMEEMFGEYFALEDRTWVGPNQAFYVFRKVDRKFDRLHATRRPATG
jgi:SAM-dependent methyltransferase